MKAWKLTAGCLSGLVAAALGLPGVSGATAAAQAWSAASAPGAPGATSYLDLGRKDCLGSATSNRSRVWFTVADGVLSDTYSPTTDNSNVSTLQFLVTDGHSFTDLQTRDMTYVARPLDDTGMSCEIVATARSGRYRIVTDYLTDPARSSVVMHTRFEPLVAAARRYLVYVRYDAMINGAGGGGTTNGGANSATITAGSHRGAGALVSYQTLARSSQTQRTYEVPVYGALAADHAYPVSSSGFVGTASDGRASSTPSTVSGPPTARRTTATSSRPHRSTPRTRTRSRWRSATGRARPRPCRRPPPAPARRFARQPSATARAGCVMTHGCAGHRRGSRA